MFSMCQEFDQQWLRNSASKILHITTTKKVKSKCEYYKVEVH